MILPRSILGLAAALLAIGSIDRAGATPRLEVRSGPSAVVSPGGFFSATVALDPDPSDPPTRLRERLLLPPGWNALTPLDLPFTPAGRGEVRMIALPVPRTAAAGSYEIYYLITAENDPARELARVPLTIVVPAVSILQVTPETAPEQVIAGDSFVVTWRILNRGNHAVAATLRIHSSQNYAVTFTPAALALPPNESTFVTATVSTPPDLRDEVQHVLLLETQGGTDGDDQKAFVKTRLLPHFMAAAPAAGNFSTTLTTTAAYHREAGQQSLGLQAEVAGHGFLDPDRTHLLDFLLRSAPTAGAAGLFSRSQYSLSYQTPAWDFLLGDNAFSLSPLTERSLSGRGIGVEYRRAASAGGIYYAQTPWNRVNEEQLGAFAEYAPWQGVRLRSNLLLAETPTDVPWMDPRSVLPSLQVFLQPAKATSIELEGALSENSTHPTGSAYRVRWQGTVHNSLYYDFERIYAAPDYFGYYHDFASSTGTVTWQVDPAWRLRTSAQQSSSNLELDPLKRSARQVTGSSAGVDRQVTRSFMVSADLAATRYVDRLPGGDPPIDQDSIAVSGKWSVPRASLRLTVEEGRRHVSGPQPADSNFQYFSLFGFLRPRPDFSLSLYVGDGGARFSAVPRHETVASGSAQLALGQGWRLRGAVSATQSHDAFSTTRDAATDAGVGYDFPGGSSVDLEVRVAGLTREVPDQGAYLSWKIPLSVPFARQRHVGSLAGAVQLRDGDTSSPLGGVILHLGRLQAATDRRGRFVFPSVKPGRYELTVDSASLGTGVMVADQGPMMIEIGPTQRVDYPVDAVRAARVEGTIDVYEPVIENAGQLAGTAEPAYRRSGNLGRVLVELRRPGLVRRTQSDEHGHFVFDRLLSGEWTATIDDHALPERHRLDRREFTVQLAAGVVTRIEVRALPMPRPIRIIADDRIAVITRPPGAP